MTKKLECPNCGMPAMSAFKKALISPSRVYRCRNCSENIRVKLANSFVVMFVAIAAVKLLETFIGSLVISFFLVLPLLLCVYIFFVPFQLTCNEGDSGISGGLQLSLSRSTVRLQGPLYRLQINCRLSTSVVAWRHAMSAAKRLAILVVLFLGAPYALIFIFKLAGDLVVGKALAIAFFLIVAVVFLTYQIFVAPAVKKEQAADRKVSPEFFRKFDLLFRAVLFLFLAGLIYTEVIPFAVDAYGLISKDERHIIEGKRYGGRGNMLFDQIMANDGTLYQYPYSIERLSSSYSYVFVALPHSRLILSTVPRNPGQEVTSEDRQSGTDNN